MHIYKQTNVLVYVFSKTSRLIYPATEIGNNALLRVTEMIDLNVTIAENLSFYKFYNNFVKQAGLCSVIILKFILSHDVNVYVNA